MAQFEGIMGNIDRRLQLYSMVSQGTYNHRAITSLDSETFFSAFQDLDPKGSGVLRSDEVPTAIGASVCLFSQRLNTNRGFHMKTSTKSRVYPVPENAIEDNASESGQDISKTDISRQVINARSHSFDQPSRMTSKPRRKPGIISRFDNQSRGAEGARLYHKNNEEKNLAHRRYGLSDCDI